MRRWLLSFGAVLALAAVALGARAGLENIEFPVATLGNCESKDACFVYCEAPEHQGACFEFARANGLMDDEEIEIARQVEYGGGGPGGCQSEDECRAFCDDSANAEQCLDFAGEHELVAPEKEEVVRELIAGNGPGGCRTEEECRTYCEDPSHSEECVAFAREHGLVDEEDVRITEIVANEGGPGGCFNEASCRAYCDEPEHLEECVDFAVEHDFMSEADAERALATGGTGPGGCRGEECAAYCEDQAHATECVEFAVEHGFISKEEAELALTVARDGGPGGCHSESECRAYCETEGHEQECFDFGVAHGLISEEKAERVQKMINKEGPGGCRGRACETYCEEPEHGEECLQFAVENDLIPPEEIDRARKGLELSKQGGPGGCRGRESCDAYCSEPDHEEECFNFAVEHDLIPAEERERVKEFKAREGELVKIVEEQGGPGGCHSKRECMAYCGNAAHEEECGSFAEAHGFAPPPRMRRGEGEEGGPSAQSFESPSGCRGPSECARYCANPANREACEVMKRKMGPPRGDEDLDRPDKKFDGEFSGPGGCGSPRECFEYCKAHEDECQSFGGKEEDSRPPPCPMMPELECSEGERKVYRREGMCPVADCRPIEEDGRGEEDRGEQSFGRPRRSEPSSFEEGSLEFEGPGGCKTPQECASFCSNNPSECGVGGGPESEPSVPPEFAPDSESHDGFAPPEGFDRRIPPAGFTGEEHRGEFRPPEGFQPPEGFRPPESFQSPRFEAQFFSANDISCDSGLNCLSACLAVANMHECRQMVKWYLMAKL